jgi:OOP family OmpA-OmpF porin
MRFTIAAFFALALGAAPVHAQAPQQRVSHTFAPSPAYEKVSFDTSTLFDSDKAELRPLGREQLDGFAANFLGLESRSKFAVGYAERRGTGAGDPVLSRNRAGTVKDYLVARGIAEDRIRTSATGEGWPGTAVLIEITGPRRTR